MATTETNFDKTDRTVIDELKEGHSYRGYEVVCMYERTEQIKSHVTAKEKAKKLTHSELFESDGWMFKYVGGGL